MIREEKPIKRIALISEEDRLRVRIRTGGELITFLVDTGSPVNVIDENTYNKMKTKPPWENANRTFLDLLQ